MSFSVQLTPDFIPVEPGATTPVTVVVINKSAEADRFELEIEGVDPEWTAVPVPTFTAEVDEAHTEKIFFKPSRASESLAGNYPFIVRIRSLNSGESKTVQAILQIKAFNHVTMEINPKKGQYSAWRKKNDFAVIAVNLGNTEHKLTLTGSDPEDACAYEFESEQITIGPGQQKEVEFRATPTSSSPLSGGRLIGFSITGRSVDHSNVAASAQAQLEQRPLITLTNFAFIFFVALIVGAWLLMMPKPLQINSFNINPQLVQRGDSVTVSWVTQQSTHVKVTAGPDTLYDGNQMASSVNYKLPTSGDVTFRIVANKDGQEKSDDRHINVKEPPTSPEPVILKMSVLQNKPIKLGASFELDYEFNSSVASAILEPTGQDINLTASRMLVKPDTAGELTYTISASNSDKSKVVKKSVTVTVVEESDATIIAFTPDNLNVPASFGRVTLSWQVSNADRVELSQDGGSTQKVDLNGEITIPIKAKTVFTLTAYDSKGRKTALSRTVNVIPDVPPQTDSGGPGKATSGDNGGGGATGNTTTSTTAGGIR